MLIGEVSDIYRYPIKSFGGEHLTSSRIESNGLYGDRCYAFVDETKEGWDSFFTARSNANMLAYQARISSDQDSDAETPTVSVTSPDGRILSWNEQLLNEIQPYSKKKLTLKSYSTQSVEPMAVDMGSILIITDKTLRKLETMWGKALDHRRFRANLVLSMDEDSFDEMQWIGKRLLVGNAALQVDLPCERCSMITIDPDTLERDASLLKKVNEEMNLSFGVYASVIKTGQVHRGDKIYLME